MLESYPSAPQALDRAFHALSDTTRRAMLDRLAAGPATVSELAQPFGCTLAAIVQHVQVLEASGLVETEKQGRSRTCRLSPGGLSTAEGWLTARRELWQARFDRLEQLLSAPQETPEEKDAP